MPPKPIIIYNPAAGKGTARKNLPKVEMLLHDHGFDYDLTQTAGRGHALVLSRQAAEEGRDLIVAAGGDGTVNEVINGLMTANMNGRKLPALGVLPIGTGNDFSFGAGIPQKIDDACETVAHGQRHQIDVGQVTGGDFPQGRYFGNGIGLGFDTVVGFEAAKITWLHGAASYFAALVKTIFLYAHAPVYEISIDGAVQQKAFLMVSVMNGRRMGGAFMTAPQSDPGDGSFDLCLAGQVSQIAILPLALRFINGSQGEHPAVEMARGRQITIRAVEGTIPAHADGETVCTAGKALTVQIYPAALEVVTRSNGARA